MKTSSEEVSQQLAEYLKEKTGLFKLSIVYPEDRSLGFRDFADDAMIRYLLASGQKESVSSPLKLGAGISIVLTVALAVTASLILSLGTHVCTVVGILLFAPVITGFFVTLWITKLLYEGD